MKKYITAFVCLLPSKLAILILKLMGNDVHWSSYIGFSIILTKNITLKSKARIGNFNLLKNSKIFLDEQAYIGHFNILKGPFDLICSHRGAVGNYNVISRANKGVTYGEAKLSLGILAKITASHSVDVTRSVTIEDYSTLAGKGSQVWTHGYIHDKEGAGRIRIDGEVKIENNVYIGSSCIVNAGVTIHKEITVGSNSTVSKDLTEPGMYVNQPLRLIKKDIDDVKKHLIKVDHENLVEDVYEKK